MVERGVDGDDVVPGRDVPAGGVAGAAHPRGLVDALRPPRGRGTRLPREPAPDARVRRRRHRAPVPPAGDPRRLDAGPVGLGERRRHRHRVPRAPLGAAGSGPHPRAARARLPPARQPARPAPAALGVPPHRGRGGGPLRGLQQDPPRDDGRRPRDEAPREVAEHRPGEAGHGAVLGRRPATGSRQPPGRRAGARSVGVARVGARVRRRRAAHGRHARRGPRAVAQRRSGARVVGLPRARRARPGPALRGAADDAQRPHHRGAAVRRTVLAAQAHPAGARAHGHDGERRHARDERRGAAALPRGPRRAAREAARGRAARRAGGLRLRQRARRDPGEPGDRRARPLRAPAEDSASRASRPRRTCRAATR